MQPDDGKQLSLLELVSEIGRQYYPPMGLPAGAHVRMHPSVNMWLLTRARPQPEDTQSTITELHSIPVTVDATMEPGTWQFIIGEGRVDGLGSD